MAFSPTEKVRIRNYLGRSELFKDLDTRLESQMDSIPTRSPEAETEIRTLLGKIAAIDDKLSDFAVNGSDIKKAEEVEFWGPEQLSMLQNRGRMLIGRLATFFEVEVLGDYFGEGPIGGVIPLG